ncbi:alcohol dehydrogenase catalytic domain-containing protein [Streptomyces sp. RKND-216]|uniref:alcohol dehydrogenase catalytic domain-containing protein n=1 Tax=Streptomyces sp. RKND-216 TaxID=2562581 RepID=UPI00248FBB79|nr:alcohol dehydrogenase catalytic domain-containing protein [Streptomyces sp. RKND-216]
MTGSAAAPGPGEVRVAEHAAGCCAEELALYDGTKPRELCRYPVTPGHEWSGVVDAEGEGAPPRRPPDGSPPHC